MIEQMNKRFTPNKPSGLVTRNADDQRNVTINENSNYNSN